MAALPTTAPRWCCVWKSGEEEFQDADPGRETPPVGGPHRVPSSAGDEVKALPHASTRADRRENLCRKKAQNRRNTLRIARFCNAFVGQIGRQDVRGELCGDA